MIKKLNYIFSTKDKIKIVLLTIIILNTIFQCHFFSMTYRSSTAYAFRIARNEPP